MHQTRKGQQRYFGMKAHVGVDSRTKVIHAVVTTAANVADATVLPDLLHGEETRVRGDQAYRGQREMIRDHAPTAQDLTNRRDRGVADEAEKARNRNKSRVQAKAEHSIGCDQAGLWLHQVALSRVGEERATAVFHLRASQPVHRPRQIAAYPSGIVTQAVRQATALRPNWPISTQHERLAERSTRPVEKANLFGSP
ncbi:MAG: family transposase [Roseomonas sp.]|nr:family transposase [Roseomonas sp.]